MITRAIACAACLTLLTASPSHAQDKILPSGTVAPLDALSLQVKNALVKALPADLFFEHNHNWGHQVHLPALDGARLVPVPANHGDWEKADLVARDLSHNLSLGVERLYFEEEHIAFDVHARIPADAELRKQIWQNGVKVFSSRLRGRCELAADLHFEVTAAPKESDGRARIEVTRANFISQHFVVANVNGLGGEFARLTGDGAQRFFKPWQPSVLSAFQKRMIAAVETACETLEARAAIPKLAREALAGAAIAARPAQLLPPPGALCSVATCPGKLCPNWYVEIDFGTRPSTEGHREHQSIAHKVTEAIHVGVHEAWGLADHSVHYLLSSSASSASHAHPSEESSHKK